MTLSILPPVHPGEILREEFLVPMEMTAADLAQRLDVPAIDVERIATEQTGVSDDMALRLARYFGTSAELWTNLQTAYEHKIGA